MTIDHLRTAIAEQVPRLQKWEVDGLAKKLEREGICGVFRPWGVHYPRKIVGGNYVLDMENGTSLYCKKDTPT